MVSNLRGASGLDPSLLNMLLQQLDGNQDSTSQSADPTAFASNLSAAGQASTQATTQTSTQVPTTTGGDASQAVGAPGTDGTGKTEHHHGFHKLSHHMKSVLLSEQEVPTDTDPTTQTSGQTTGQTAGDASGTDSSNDSLNVAVSTLLTMMESMGTSDGSSSFDPSAADRNSSPAVAGITGTTSASATGGASTGNAVASVDGTGGAATWRTEWQTALADAASGKTTGGATEGGLQALAQSSHLHNSVTDFLSAIQAQQSQTVQTGY